MLAIAVLKLSIKYRQICIQCATYSKASMLNIPDRIWFIFWLLVNMIHKNPLWMKNQIWERVVAYVFGDLGVSVQQCPKVTFSWMMSQNKDQVVHRWPIISKERILEAESSSPKSGLRWKIFFYLDVTILLSINISNKTTACLKLF